MSLSTVMSSLELCTYFTGGIYAFRLCVCVPHPSFGPFVDGAIRDLGVTMHHSSGLSTYHLGLW